MNRHYPVYIACGRKLFCDCVNPMRFAVCVPVGQARVYWVASAYLLTLLLIPLNASVVAEMSEMAVGRTWKRNIGWPLAAPEESATTAALLSLHTLTNSDEILSLLMNHIKLT